MEIAFTVRKNQGTWGGDMAVINDLVDELNRLGSRAATFNGKFRLTRDTRVVLTNSTQDLSGMARPLRAKNRPYHVLPFHEDFIDYWQPAMGFARFSHAIITGQPLLDRTWRVEDLEENPEIIRYAPAITVPLESYKSRETLEFAQCSIPSSAREEKTIKRDSPRAKTTILRFPTDLSARFEGATRGKFTSEYGIPGGYVLQVGRLETRKNQLATVFALRDLPAPLVFIATRTSQPWYTRLVLEAIVNHRKHPTWVVSQDLEERQIGPLTVKRMTDSQKLPWPTLGAAYLDAAANCHPAFHELPGLTYIESISLGCPTVCSTMASIDEYLLPDLGHPGVTFVQPADLKAIRTGLEACVREGQNSTAQLVKIKPSDYADQFLQCLSWA